MAVVDELVTLLSFKLGAGSEQAIKSIKDGIETARKEVTKWAAAATAAGTATALFLTSSSEKAVGLQKLAQATNMSTDSLQQWMYAAESVGASANTVAADLENMVKSMSSPIPGELNMELMMLGVSVRNASGELRGADEVLQDVGQRLNKMGNQEALQWAERVGVSNDTLMLLKQGKQGLAELFEEAQLVGAIIPADAIERGAELSKSLNTLKRIFGTMGQSIALSFAPNLKKVVDNFKNFLIANGEFIRQGLGTVIEGVGKGFSRFWNIIVKTKDGIVSLIKPLAPLTENLDAVKVVAGLVTGALAGFVALMAPAILQFAAVGAAIAGVALVIEDLITWIQGGESVTGDIIAAFSNWLDQFPELKEDIQAVGQVFSDVFGAIPGVVDKCIDSLKGMFPVLSEILRGLGKVIDFVYTGTKNVTEKTTEGLLNAFADYEGKGAFKGKQPKMIQLPTADEVDDMFNEPITAQKSGKDAGNEIMASLFGNEPEETAAKAPAEAEKEKGGFWANLFGIGDKQLETMKLMAASAKAPAEAEKAYQTMPVPAAMTTNNTNNNANSTINNNQTITIMTGADSRSVIQAMQDALPDANVVSSGTYGSFIGGY